MQRHHLSLKEHLSQAWADKHVILLALLLLKVHLFSRSLKWSLETSSDLSHAMCTSLADTLASDPDLIVRTTHVVLQSALEGLDRSLKLFIRFTVSVVKALIGFAIELYLGTLTCLCVAFVRGATECLAEATKAIASALETAVNTVTKEFNKSLGALSVLVNGMIGTFEALKSVFTKNRDRDVLSALNKVNLTISGLRDISVPTGFATKLERLADEVPDFTDTLSNLTSWAVLPLTKLSNLLQNKTLVAAALPTPKRRNIDEFFNNATSCDLLQDTFEKITKKTDVVHRYILMSIAAATFLLTLFVVVSTYYSQRYFTRLVDDMAVESDRAKVGDMLSTSEHKLFYKIFAMPWDIRFKWLWSYCMSARARFVLLAGSVALLSVGLQFVILKSAEAAFKHPPDVSFPQSKELTTIYLNATQESLRDAAAATNRALLLSIQEASNSTYNVLVDAQGSVNKTINGVFKHTPFAAPLRTIIYCTVGRKIEKITSGMKWINDNFKVLYPQLLDEDIIQLASGISESNNKKLEDVSDFAKDAFEKVIAAYKKTLRVELYVACGILGLWVILLLFGIAFLVHHSFNRQPPISAPQRLSGTQRKKYEYPFRDPYKTQSSMYSL